MNDYNNVIKTSLDIIKKIENKILEEELEKNEYYCYFFESEWYNWATNEMANRIKKGEYPVDVINDLAREFSNKTDGSYESFSFAKDALDRRAWELGLRYTNNDNTMYTDIKHHDGNITDKVTEKLDLMEDDVGFFKGLFPSSFGKLSGSLAFWKLRRRLTRDLLFNINKKYAIKIKNKTFSISDIYRYLINEKNVSKYFIEDVNEKIKRLKPSFKLNQPIVDNDTYKNIMKIIILSMLYTSGIVDSIKEVYYSVSENVYEKDTIDKEKNFTSDLSNLNVSQKNKEDIKKSIIDKISKGLELSDNEKKFIINIL